MFIQPNQLRMSRRRSRLTLADIAFLMNQSDDTHISRFESGDRPGSVALMLVYHLLFGVPMEGFFQRQKEEVTALLRGRIISLLANLEDGELAEHHGTQIDFLKDALARLAQQDSHG